MDFCLANFIREKFEGNPSLSEICINGRRSISLYSDTKESIESIFKDDDEATYSIQIFSQSLGVRLDPNVPCNGGVFEEKFRWHAVIPPASFSESIFTVRRHCEVPICLDQFGLDPQFNLTLKEHIAETPIVIYGDTGSGKTTLLMSILKKFCFDERVVFVEQIPEVSLHSPEWVRVNSVGKNILNAGGTNLVEMVEHALRLRPERLVLGEVRKIEVEALALALRVGHASVLWTMHGRTVKDIASRIESTQMQRMLAIRVKDKKVYDYQLVVL